MDSIKAVQLMQDYIKHHVQDNDFKIEQVCASVGYSRWHTDRIFKVHIGKTLQEYISAVCLTQSATELLETTNRILKIALNSHFMSHEGFTRSFSKKFHITPSEYREKNSRTSVYSISSQSLLRFA